MRIKKIAGALVVVTLLSGGFFGYEQARAEDNKYCPNTNCDGPVLCDYMSGTICYLLPDQCTVQDCIY